MADEFTISTACDTPDQTFEEDDIDDRIDTHVALCEDCTEDDIEVTPPESAETATATDGGTAAVQPAPEQSPEKAVDSQEEFVSEIAGVPDVFVVDMGRGKESKPYVTKEGLAHLARKLDLQVRAEPIVPSWEAEKKVAYRGIVEDDEGRTWTDVGTATHDKETIGNENLDELASTRATNRALRLATGAGMTSLEEMDEGAENAISDDPDVVDVEEVSADA